MGLDFWTTFKLILLGIIILIGFLQFLYKAFIRPLQNAEARRRQQERGQDPTRDPAMEIRDFLAEIRGEKAAPPKAGRADSGREIIWEVVTEDVPRQAEKRPKRETP